MRVAGCLYRANVDNGDLALSPADLRRFADQLPGARVLVEHDPLARIGTVHDAFLTPNGDLGAILDVKTIPPGMEELSLRHDVFDDTIKGPAEVSVVYRGARQGTGLCKRGSGVRSEAVASIMASAAPPQTTEPVTEPASKKQKLADESSDVVLQNVLDRLGGSDGELASELVNRFGNVANKAAASLEQLEKARVENQRLQEENAKYADERKAVEVENKNTSKKLVSSFAELMKTLAPDFAFGGEEEDAQKLRESYEHELQNSAIMRAFLSHVPVAASAASQLKRQTQASLKGVAEVEKRVSQMGGSLVDSPAAAAEPADDQARLLATLKKLSQF